MRRENVNYLVVGIFVSSVGLFLLFILYSLAADQEDTDQYYFVFKNITGIKVGTKITYGGYRIGTVKAIDPIYPNKETRFRIRAEIKKGWVIPSKSIPQIVAPNMLAEQQIDIKEVKSKTNLKANSDYLQEGQSETSFMTMMNDVAKEVKLVSNEKIRPLLENLNRQIDKIGDGLSVQIPMLAENTNKLILNLNQGVEDMKVFLGKDNQASVKELLGNINSASSDLKKFSGKLASLMKKMDELVTENKRGIKQSVISMRKSLETISSRINSIVYNIEQTTRNFNEFSHKIRQNPGLLIGGKSPKERGVYRR